MGRKVFISVLGTGFYEKCKYTSNGFCSEEIRFVQEATLLQIGAHYWSKNDTAIILLTEKATSTNWDLKIVERKRHKVATFEPYENLQSRTLKLNLPIEIQALDIPDGKNEEEMWQIFNLLFSKIEEEDELYFDLTHSFRYLPMLVLVFGNYVKFLKNVKVVHISYGNYEARNLETNEAPIIDLLSISALQDWTFASANYLENGNVKKLVELCNTELKPILIETKGKDQNVKNLQRFVSSLDKVIAERVNCRGINIVTSENFKILKQTSDKLTNTFIEPLNPIFDRIKESFVDFDENENVMNGFAAVKWCLDFGLYQQAATILIENIITFVCCKNCLNWRIEAERLLVNCAFKVKDSTMPEDTWKVSNKEIDAMTRQDLVEKVKNIIHSFEVELLHKLFVSLSELRNDFNHAGIRNNPMSADALKKNLIERYNSIKQIITSC